MKPTWTLAAAFLLSSSAALAQDGSEQTGTRTVEDAQQFLDKYYRSLGYGRVNLMAWPDGNGLRLGKEPSREAGGTYVSGDMSDMSSVARCESNIVVSNLFTYTPFLFERGDPVSTDGTKFVRVIDWSTVTKVTVRPRTGLTRVPLERDVKDGSFIVVIDGPARDGVSFRHGSEESANRAANAMEYLREQCGFNTDTGF